MKLLVSAVKVEAEAPGMPGVRPWVPSQAWSLSSLSLWAVGGIRVSFVLFFLAESYENHLVFLAHCAGFPKNYSQLWRVDHSARRSMKNAANCAKHGELQGFMKPLLVERILRPWLTGQGHIHLRVEESRCSSERLSTGRRKVGLWTE